MISLILMYFMVFSTFFCVFGVIGFMSAMIAYYVQYRVKLTQLNNKRNSSEPYDLQFYQDKADLFYARFKVFRFWTILLGIIAHIVFSLIFILMFTSIFEFGAVSSILSNYVN